MNGCVTLNGREYTLRYSVNALCLLEDRAGGSLETLLSKGMSGLRGLLWCGLLEENKGITLETAGELMQSHLASGGSIRDISVQVALALENAGFFHPAGTEALQEA